MTEEAFAVLGGGSFAEQEIVSLPPPQWIQSLIFPFRYSSEASRVSGRLDSDPRPIAECEWTAALPNDLLHKLKAHGIKHWFPVQIGVIPALLRDIEQPSVLPPRDICVSAPTGSGKTLAYVLPVIAALRSRIFPRTQALVLVPQSDLATQVHRVFKTYAEGTNVRVLLMTGQKDLTAEEASLKREKAPDVVVATPGRLMDHLLNNSYKEPEDRYFRLDSLRYLIMDEADRLMLEGQMDWLSAVEAAVFVADRQRLVQPSYANLLASNRPPLQKLLFSATLSSEPGLLAEWGLFQPRLFAVHGHEEGTEMETKLFAFPTDLTHNYVICDPAHKPLVLYQFLKEHSEWTRVLCFARSQESSHRLRVVLEELGVENVEELGAQLLRSRRQRVLSRFQNQSRRVVISTDLAGRGLDVTGITAVVNYDVPRDAAAYAHRVGRTARAGLAGTALTLLAPRELPPFQLLLEEAGHWALVRRVEGVSAETLEPLLPVYQQALAKLQHSVKEEQSKKRLNRKRNISSSKS